MTRHRNRQPTPERANPPMPTSAFVTFMVLGLVALLPTQLRAQSTINVDDAKVGIGIDVPTDLLHVYGSDTGTADTVRMRLENTADTVKNRRLIELRNNGPVTVRYNNTAANGMTWNLNALPGGFVMSVAGSGVNELSLAPSGDLTILGTLNQGSSREWKQDISEVESREVLDRVDELEIRSWRYEKDTTGALHLGPMAEDFHEVFGLGTDEQHLAPADAAGVALAAIQGLYDLIRERDAEIDELRDRLARIETERSADQPAEPETSQ